MLIEAKLVEDQLIKLWTETKIREPKRFRYYELFSYSDHIPKIEESDYTQIDRASIIAEGGEVQEVLGFISARVDRDANAITGLSLWSAKPNRRFIRDCWAFLEELRQRFSMIRFSAIVGGSPARLWARCAARMGGRIIGRKRKATRLDDGKLYDLIEFEVPGADSFPAFEESDQYYQQLVERFESERRSALAVL